MADDATVQDTTWPLTKFRFEVDFGNGLNSIPFQEVSGLETEAQVIEYRKGNSAAFSTVKMPGMKKYGNVTLRKGIFINDNTVWAWISGIQMSTMRRNTIVIKLLDEIGGVAMAWQLQNAWPTKVSGTDLKSDANEVAIETIELVHDGLTISNS
ncbi:MAG: phage tail protein [Pedobacter sp.]|nr:MAG: phage tail protein [Pedobacter sp.]